MLLQFLNCYNFVFSVLFTDNSTITDDLTSTHVSIETQTSASLTSKTPRKRVLQQILSNALGTIRKLERLQQTTIIEYCMKICEQYLSSSVYLLVKS